MGYASAALVIAVLGAIALYFLTRSASLRPVNDDVVGPALRGSWLVEAWVGKTLRLRTRIDTSEPFWLPIAPLLTGSQTAQGDVITIDDGQLGVPPDVLCEPDGNGWSLMGQGFRVRLSPSETGTPFERVAPLPAGEVPRPAPLVQGEPNPFEAIWHRWHDSLDDEDRAWYEEDPYSELKQGPPFDWSGQEPLDPISADDTEETLFLFASVGTLEDGQPSWAYDIPTAVPLGGDGTGDGLFGVPDGRGNLVLFWAGHDPYGVFYRGPSLRAFFAACPPGVEWEQFASAMHPYDAPALHTPVPPCFLSGPPHVVDLLDRLPQDAALLDFRGLPPGAEFEYSIPPVQVIDGHIVVLEHAP